MIDMDKMRTEIKKIMKNEDLKYIIGYEKGTYGWRISPLFAKTDDDIDKFIFSPLCINNLVTYTVLEEKLPLPKGEKAEKKKIGIIVKGCDSRACLQLIQEKAISRDEILLIGVPCNGIIDPKKMQKMYKNELSIIDVEDNKDKYFIKISGKKTEVLKDKLIFENCKTCEYQTPVIYDILIGEETKDKKTTEYSEDEKYFTVNEIEKKSINQRWDYWQENFDRCIRCYACRSACPICNCNECMAEKLNPIWIRRSVNSTENMGFHVLKAYHTAGRCIGCGTCERVCPMNIPLTNLYKKVEKDVIELFDYKPGLNEEDKPLFSVYKEDDTNENIL